MDLPRPRSLSERFRHTFARHTSSGRFIPEIDGLRFPAIALVVIGHLAWYYRDRGHHTAPHSLLDRAVATPPRFATVGVLLFFIISGFVLALPFALHHRGGAERVSLRAYLLRRLTRLEPPYLITLALLMGLQVAVSRFHLPGSTGTPSEILRHAAASAAYLHNLIYGTASTINSPAWSLEVEVQFYLLVPLLAAVFRIRAPGLRRALMVAIALGSIALQLALGSTHPRLALSILGHLQYFLAGFLLADLYLFGGLREATRHHRWDLVALGAWSAVFILWERGPWTALALPFVALLAFVSAFRGRLTNRVFRNAWITTLGGMCYSIYLIHLTLLAILARMLQHVLPLSGTLWVDFLTHGTLVLAGTLAVCIGFYYLVERPCMDRHWPRRLMAHLWRAPRPVPSVAR